MISFFFKLSSEKVVLSEGGVGELCKRDCQRINQNLLATCLKNYLTLQTDQLLPSVIWKSKCQQISKIHKFYYNKTSTTWKKKWYFNFEGLEWDFYTFWVKFEWDRKFCILNEVQFRWIETALKEVLNYSI